MLSWFEKRLKRLPSHETMRGQGRDCRWSEWVSIGLESKEAASLSV